MGAVRDSIENWGKLSTVQRWQAAFESVHGPHPTVRHILLTLATRMDKSGDRQFPGVRELERRTGLSQRTIVDRLDEADEQGWVRRLVVVRRRSRCRQYLPAIPGEVLKEVQHLEARLIREGAEVLSAPLPAEILAEAAENVARGAEESSNEVLKELQPSSSGSSSESSSVSYEREDEDETERDQARVAVPDDFDAGELADLRLLNKRLESTDRAWAAKILTAEVGYPAGPSVGRFHELERLPPARLRELQFAVASRNGQGESHPTTGGHR